jgi:hypothetical protein
MITNKKYSVGDRIKMKLNSNHHSSWNSWDTPCLINEVLERTFDYRIIRLSDNKTALVLESELEDATS